MILLYCENKDLTPFPFFVADTIKDKQTFPYGSIEMALEQYSKKVFRYEEYSKMLKRIEESSSDTVIIDITNIDITDAEEAEATIYSAYPELLL
jgi:hypothetical protein